MNVWDAWLLIDSSALYKQQKGNLTFWGLVLTSAVQAREQPPPLLRLQLSSTPHLTTLRINIIKSSDLYRLRH